MARCPLTLRGASLALFPLLAALSGCAGSLASANQKAGTVATTQPRTLVVWISVDGFRPDYLGGADAPFLKSLKSNGAWTDQLTPPFPSLTFASHASEATGASPAVHGIPGNSFYDRHLDQEFSFPPRPDLLKAEPIWTAATRQGLRVAVFDWPFSQAQHGANTPAYSVDAYDTRMTDATRLGRLVDVLRYDPAQPQPVSLAMGYVEGVDHAGHDMGPLSRAPVEQLERIDKLLEEAHAQAIDTLHRKFPKGSTLYFLVSTDHGMAPVIGAVNLRSILRDVLPDDARIITGGGTAHVFLPDSPAKPAQIAAIRRKLADVPLLSAFTKDTLPTWWSMYDPDRVGDVFVNLPAGYIFSFRGPDVATYSAPGTTRPAARAAERGPRGMHSYDPLETRDMLGFTVVSRYPNDFGGIYLGKLDNRRLAPTVAAWLGISPPAQSQVKPLSRVVP
jgi:hypothetical protein